MKLENNVCILSRMFKKDSQNSIQVQSLQKSFRTGFWRQKREVIKDVSFTVSTGCATGFVGSNGSGKTTSLKLILGFLKPDSGNVQIFGSPLTTRIKSQIGYLPERPFYYEHLTAGEFLKFHWDLGGGGEGFPVRSRDCLESVHLSHAADQRLRSFSKGMQQRVGMAHAL
ncbi:MAG: ABC transporter ATP-binding protein, partial [Bdellovibrio sp.]